MEWRVKPQRCVIDCDEVVDLSEWQSREGFEDDGGNALAIAYADCDSPPDEWVHAAREAYYEAPAGHYWSMIAACVAFLAAARAEAEGGR